MYFNVPFYVCHQKQKDVFESVCRIPMITSAKEEQRMIATCRKVNSILSQSNRQLLAAVKPYLSSVRLCTKALTVSLYRIGKIIDDLKRFRFATHENESAVVLFVSNNFYLCKN